MIRKGSDAKACPLCGSVETEAFERDERRPYYICVVCGLVFVPAEFHVSRRQERARYDLHENSILDKGYTEFLSRLIGPLATRCSAGSEGLDFGSGPDAVLAQLLKSEGFDMNIYDSFYAANTEVLEQSYDFITLTEVLEHLSRPLEEISALVKILRPRGVIAVMMRLLDDSDDFLSWHYKNDQTHVCFYSWRTILWVAATFDLNAERVESDIVLLEKGK